MDMPLRESADARRSSAPATVAVYRCEIRRYHIDAVRRQTGMGGGAA
jgi:hypothetical protein